MSPGIIFFFFVLYQKFLSSFALWIKFIVSPLHLMIGFLFNLIGHNGGFLITSKA